MRRIRCRRRRPPRCAGRGGAARRPPGGRRCPTASAPVQRLSGRVGCRPPGFGFGQQRLLELEVELGRSAPPGRDLRGRLEVRCGERPRRGRSRARRPRRCRPGGWSGWHRYRASRAGRSAVRSTRRRPEWAASMTAGSRFPTAVPDVVTTATGVRDPAARPSARNPADRSSTRTCSRTSPAASAAYSATPGRRSASRGRGRPRAPHPRRGRRGGVRALRGPHDGRVCLPPTLAAGDRRRRERIRRRR